MQAILTDFREVWQYRSLLRMLVERDLKTRYKSSALGVLWSFLQPLGMMVVMTLVAFNTQIGKNQSNWHIYILSGLLAWNFFSASVIGGTGSIMANAALVKKVYFPRLVLPISTVLSALVNYMLALPMFLLVALLSGHPLSLALAWMPLVIAIQTLFSIGIAFLLSTLNVFYRDTQFILELAMLALFFLTPIWYPLDDFTSSQSSAVWVRRLNPMASIVNMYQDIMYRGVSTSPDFVLRTVITAIAVAAVGYLVFRKYSARFGEEV